MDVRPALKKKLTRREALSLLSKSALAASLLGVSCARPKRVPVSVPTPPALTDDQFLDQMERAAILFFWERASDATGQVLDRAYATGTTDTRTVSSIAATGFGLSALCIAAKRGYLTTSRGRGPRPHNLEFHLGAVAATQRVLLSLRGHEHRAAGKAVGSVVDRYIDPAVRRAYLPAILQGPRRYRAWQRESTSG